MMEDIVITGLRKAFGPKEVLRDFNLTIPDGSLVCLMGPSGCGKTTLLRILMGLEHPDKGTVSGLVNRRLAAVFQEDRLCENFSARDNLSMVCRGADAPARIEAHLSALGLAESAGQKVCRLSGGMRRRVAIARALLAPCQLLILDEPFKGLDERMREITTRWLRENSRGITTIMVTHDAYEVELLEGKLIRMEMPG